MNTIQTKNRDFEAIAWGALFVWWGLTEMVSFLPEGSGALGVGLILIGVNLARQQMGLRIPWFSLTVGILALIWGGLELAGAMLNLPFELPIFAILLIALGLILLIPAFSGREGW
jgi:hypothetical protein